MGLPIDPDTILATNRFVAVEFDTYVNGWDPKDSNNDPIGDHVGVTIGNLTGISLTSVRYQKWLSKSVLAERVIFGFSAATGASFQKNNVKSWSFSSTDVQDDEIGSLPPNRDPDPLPPNPNPDSLPPNPGPDPVGDKSNNVVLIAGLSVAVTFLAVLAFVLWRKKQKNKEDEAEELQFNAEMNSEFEMGNGPTRFSYHKLAQSTGNFAEDQKLGEGDLRPSIRQAIQVLNSEASLPILPSKMPVASYLSLPISSLHGVVSIVQNQFSSSNDNTDSSKQTATTSSTASSASPSVSLLHSMQ
ncbi:hypothetical protein L6452_27994 [Arctium lappa]|uniref:Uncharacterized protein n=1 Tax=Arctium lappa TaxID=4217 RepID=A0ACB8ZX17_ARCLA|nr:hypothetical protein L6452_27994 [Arctium lappa]